MATLTIDLDDEATEGLVALNDQLEQTAAVTDTVADAAANLSEVQQQQLVVINKSTAGWSQLADTSINAFGKIAGAGLHAFGSITSAAMRAADAANLLEHSADVGKAVAYFAASKAGWDSVEKAAGVAGTTIAKRVLGLGPQFLGATIALEAYSAVLARTGLKTVELADGTTILESNLDRVNAAASRFGSDVSRDFKEAADAAATLIDIVNPFPDIWKEIDKVATKSAENLVDNIGLVRQGYNDSVISLRAFAVEMQGGSGEAYKKEIESLRELSEWHAKMDQQRANEISHFDRLRDANAATEARAAARGEAERIASFKSTAAIDAEIQKMKDKAGQQAAALKFDEAAQTAFNSTMIALEQRRQAVEKETSAKRSENYKKATEEYTEQMRQADDMIARHR